ncbi:MAG: DUF4261 domain-containing protein [Pseudoclavibacter sp.]
MPVSLAMLLKDGRDSNPVTGATLAARLVEDWPDLDHSRMTVEPDRGPGTAALAYDGASIAVSTVPAPLDADLDELAANSGQWPLTLGPPRDCTSYAVVAVIDPDERSGHSHALARAALLSRVLVSALHLDDGFRAVFWGAANHLVHPANFLHEAKRLPGPMMAAWAAITVGARHDGTMSGFTRGLDMLGLLDLELPATGDTEEQAFERLAGLTMYQLEHGPVLGDGQTIAGPHGDVMLVQHTESADGEGRQVARLTAAPRKKRGLFGLRRT